VWLVLRRAPAAPVVPVQWHGERACAMAVCYSGDLTGVDEVLAPVRAFGETRAIPVGRSGTGHPPMKS